MKTIMCFLATLLLSFLNCKGQNNVILVILDDWGLDQMESFNLGSTYAVTPTIDSLKTEGALFTNFTTYPVCSPTRAAMLTGKYGFRTNVGDVVDYGETDMDTSFMTIPKVLNNFGIPSAMIGKYHLGVTANDKKKNPIAQGFSYYAGNLLGMVTNNYYWDRTVATATTLKQAKESEYITTKTVDDAIDWINSQTAGWFLWLSFNAPHEPFQKPPVNLIHTPVSGNSSDILNHPEKYYRASLEALDTELGRLVAHLKEKGQYESTTIFLMGDNGTPKEAVDYFPIDHTKGSLYEGGIRAPLLVSGNLVKTKNVKKNGLVSVTDLYSTILNCFGVTNGQIRELNPKNDSRSFYKTIVNNELIEREWVFSERFPSTNEIRLNDGVAISNGNYKLIIKKDGGNELYNLNQDPLEVDNILSNNGRLPDNCLLKSLCDSLFELTGIDYCNGIDETNRNCITTGINNLEFKINLYPNPSDKWMKIKLPFQNLLVNYKIIDLTGVTRIEKGGFFGDFVIETSDLSNGLYLLQINVGEETLSEKIIIQHW